MGHTMLRPYSARRKLEAIAAARAAFARCQFDEEGCDLGCGGRERRVLSTGGRAFELDAEPPYLIPGTGSSEPATKGTRMTDWHDEIAAQEQELEALADRYEQSRKVALAAKGMIGVGGLLLALTLVGALGRSPLSLVLGVGALLGGIALYGSNRSTLDEIRATIRDRERRRADLIGQRDLRLVQP